MAKTLRMYVWGLLYSTVLYIIFQRGLRRPSLHQAAPLKMIKIHNIMTTIIIIDPNKKYLL